ncbi:MAG: CHC2 zinc finger domain-containing protein [Candidatus Taylorbacteria bacterium]|nr:CHC2 zinc finger domain-containing protein [Candidatus Taylorbacteria bacterium]
MNIKSKREIYSDMEREWRKSLPRYSDQELLGIFPEAKEIIPKKIRENQKKYNELKEKAKKLLKKARQIAGKDAWFTRLLIKAFYAPNLIKYEKRILRLRNYSKPENIKVENFTRKVEKAREYPILQLAEGLMNLRRKGTLYSSLCPFHNEKTPSFFIYPNNNSYYCFGCGVHGDVISLAEQLYNVQFKEAVMRLQ